MIFYSSERTALFIDGVNLHSCSKALGFDVDYKKLVRFFCSRGVFVRAFYYTPLCDDQEYSPLRPLVDWLAYNSYDVVTRVFKNQTDGGSRGRVRSRTNVELIVDFMRMSDYIDHLVLFSGDGDLQPMLGYVQNKGRRVSVVSTVRTQPSMVSDELRRKADQFIELDLLRPCLERSPSDEERQRVSQACDESV